MEIEEDTTPASAIAWDIRRESRVWDAHEARPRFHLAPRKMELIEGKLFCTDEDRLMVLGLLLENLGADAAVNLGTPTVWREAVAKLEI